MPHQQAPLSSPWQRSLFLSLILAFGCVEPFDTTRQSNTEELGEELYGLVCDRVGAQSLRDDITGESYQDVCHRTAEGDFEAKVDTSHLPILSNAARDRDDKPVPMEKQKAVRDRAIARVEALGEERDELMQAFTAMLPDVTLPTRAECGEAVELYDALLTALSEFVPLYEDETVPGITRAFGALLDRIETDPELSAALSRMATREGYRPRDLALYVLKPILSYPRLFDLGAAFADVHRENKNGARDKLANMLDDLAVELREMATEPSEPKSKLELVPDAVLGFDRISRPRSVREVSLSLLSNTARPDVDEKLWIVKRDARGLALVRKNQGALPYPFMPNDDGEPLTDALGRFMTQNGAVAPLPFAASADREQDGRARTSDGQLMFDYLPIPSSVFSEVSASFAPLFVPRQDNGVEAMLDAIELLGPLLGGQSTSGPEGTAHYDAKKAPLVTFTHALTTTLARPEMEDALALFEKLTRERPEVVSRLVQLLLKLDAVADRYPEVSLRDESTFWDEMLDVVAELAHKDGLLEDIFRSLSDERTQQLGKVIASYMQYRDEISYYRDGQNPTSFDSLNGQAFNLTTGDFSDMRTPVDRSLPDSGQNRSVLQRFLQLLHDANGLSACSKAGAIAHVDIKWPPGALGIPIRLDYPTNILAKTVCTFLGTPATETIPECGILRFDNVAALIVKVALGEYTVEVRDPCLAKLVDSPLTGLVGGAQAFLEETSGIKGFGVTPTVQGVARLAFFDAPYTEWGGYSGDSYYPKTRDFLKDVIAPVPSTVCPVSVTQDPFDGSPIELRRCERYEDTLRGRDPNGLFPLEQLGFLQAVQPLARAFDDHDATLTFVSIMDTMHKHWGTAKQSREECDPSLPKTHARWCSQDGLSAYEPMLAEMMSENDLFGELSDVLELVDQTTISHCEQRDAQGACVSASTRSGITVMAEMVRALVDPAKSPGLVSRHGKALATRNDGSEGSAVTPAHLWLEALSELRKGFGGEGEKTWKAARSHLVDTLLAVEDRDGQPRFKLGALDLAMPQALLMLRQQLVANCPNLDAGARCAWIDQTVTDFSEAVEDPLTARLVDVLDALRADEASRLEIGRLSSHLLGLDQEAHASFVAALMDFLQVLDDDASLKPVMGLMADAMSDGKGAESVALAPQLLDLLASFFAKDDASVCAGVDPHHAFAYVFNQAVTPMAKGERAPIEVLIDAALRVNRVDPRKTSVLLPEDMQMLGKEMSALMLDPASGLEQLYAVLKQAQGGAP